MKLHANAALSLNQRRRLVRRVVDEGSSLAEAAKAAEVSERTATKWVHRYRAEGEAGLLDRSSAPHHVHNRPPESRVQVIAWLRRLRMTGPEIAEVLEMATSTVGAVLDRIGLGKLSRLEPPSPLAATRSSAPVSCSTSTSRSSGGSAPREPATGPSGGGPSTGVASGRPSTAVPASGSAGSSPTSASTTRPGSPTPRCSPTSARPPRSPSSVPAFASTASAGSRSSG
jgi:transposase